MPQLIADATLGAKLRCLNEPAEIYDESGKLLGRFTPAPDLSQHGPLEPQVSEKELDRRSQSSEKTYTTTEVLEHLEKL